MHIQISKRGRQSKTEVDWLPTAALPRWLWVVGKSDNEKQCQGTPRSASASSLPSVSDALVIKVTTGQMQTNSTDLTGRAKQAKDSISPNKNKPLACEKDLKRRIQPLTRNLEQIHRIGCGESLNQK